MASRAKSLYEFFITFPDRLYPFKCQIEGEWVRGRRSYEQAVARANELYGQGRIGYKLDLYREVFHFIGSLLFIVAATVISHRFFGGDRAFYVLFVAAVLALTYQEFYVHPKRYGQHVNKGMADWFTWVAPMVVYVFFFLS